MTNVIPPPADPGVLQSVIIGPCSEETMDITVEAGAEVWFWVGPTVLVKALFD